MSHIVLPMMLTPVLAFLVFSSFLVFLFTQCCLTADGERDFRESSAVKIFL